MNRYHALAAAAVIGATVLPMRACGPFTVYDCTIAHPRLEFVGGNTHTKATFWCTTMPHSLSIQIRTYWRNKSARKWDLVSKKTITLADVPPGGRHKNLDILGACYSKTRERVHIYGQSTSSTGQLEKISRYAPNRYGKPTLLCNIIGGH